jgi:uracil-DNA glycosylase
VSAAQPLAELLREVRACRVCAEHLPHGPRPVLCADEAASLLVVGQAPGSRVHESGIPWRDASGERLRSWLGLDLERFEDPTLVAMLPMGFCYPGAAAGGGDLPPRPECAPLWHGRVLERLPGIELTLLVGAHAQARYLGARRARTMTETVRAFARFAPAVVPLPHPSWRSVGWQRRNPWFEEELVPELRAAVVRVLVGRGDDARG